MAVIIKKPEQCTGCGTCVRYCPMDVLRLDQKSGKVTVAYPQECMCCIGCELECPRGVLYVTPEKHDPVMVSWK